jgi:hypothetical protein
MSADVGCPTRHHCAEWARNVNLDPGGTAPTADVFVLVEHPLPWPRDIGADPLLAAVEQAACEAAVGRRVRLQAVVVEQAAATRKVIVFTATRSPFSGYGRVEGFGLPGQLPAVTGALVAQEPPPPEPGVTDVLICTHGTRDTCCGSLGTRLWRDAQDDLVRVWRTSHTGGHRFAPTAVTFPDGNYWAFLDPDLLAGIVSRSVDPLRAAAHLRGCAAFPPAIQVADRVGLEAHGWSWVASARFGEERSASRVEVCFETPEGIRGGIDVCLGDGRRMPVPDCGNDPGTATKSQVELTITHTQSWV